MKRTLRLLLVLAITALLFGLFLWKSDPAIFMKQIRSMDLRWFALAMLTNVLVLVLRTQRWRTIINPEEPPPFFPTFFATGIGFMSSAILPSGAANVVRPALLRRKVGIRFSTAFGTILIEKVLDLIGILTLFSIFLISSISGHRFPPERTPFLRTAGLVAIPLLFAMVTLVVVVYFFHARVRGVHAWIGGVIPARFRGGWMSFFDSFVRSLDIAHHHRQLVEIIFLTGCIWLGLCGQISLVLLALGHPVPVTAGYFITGMAIVGMMIPTPGGIGGFHKATQIILTSFYNFDVNSSVAAALIAHFVGTVPVVIVGLLLFLHEGLSVKELKKIAAEGGVEE
ncbi:MAG TPA: lysylphosphatidylglycerol synthase transmembrane domain-containing protein [Thermoanaerobaculia bacterium]|nr:lysylphosphatidylglycerol synthase transmembrane domain-containing protein [Thermoanaerobaculia bacterium]